MSQAIRAVAAGQAVFGPAIASRMMNFFQGLNSAPQTGRPVAAFPELTEREREVLTLITKGVSNKDIAEKLFISMKTVSNHITNIFSKLQVADRAQAILRARSAGVLADAFGSSTAIAAITFLSGAVVALVMRETLKTNI